MELQLSTDRQIGQLRSRYDIQPHPDNTLTFAFEDRRYVKLSAEINHGSDILKKKCLQEVRQDFHKGDSVTLALLSSDILSVMVSTLKHPQADIRQLAMEGLRQVASVKQGREHLMQNGRVAAMVDLIDDSTVDIRKQCYLALIEFVDFLENCQHLLEDGCDVVTRLVDKMIEEKQDEIQMLNLRLVDRLITGPNGVDQLLKTPAIKRLLALAGRPQGPNGLVSLALECLGSLSFHTGAKEQIQEQGGVLSVANRLYDDCPQILVSATKALASLAQLIPAKHALIDHDHFPRILALLAHPDQQIQLNIIQLLTSLAEHPIGRQVCLQQCLPELKSRLANNPSCFLNEYIEQAIEVITWVP